MHEELSSHSLMELDVNGRCSGRIVVAKEHCAVSSPIADFDRHATVRGLDFEAHGPMTGHSH